MDTTNVNNFFPEDSPGRLANSPESNDDELESPKKNQLNAIKLSLAQVKIQGNNNILPLAELDEINDFQNDSFDSDNSEPKEGLQSENDEVQQPPSLDANQVRAIK